MKHNYPLDQAPRRHHIILKPIADLAFWLSGWKLVGEVANTSKLLVIAAPHRSGWEVALGLMTICTLGVDARWMGKHTIFRWPIGYLARWFGGIAIDRRQAHGVVGDTVKQLKEREQLFIVMMPEGTRSKVGGPVSGWKKGYYYIGHKAAVPVMPIYIDHANKRVVFGETVSLAADQETCAEMLQEFYDHEKGISQSLSQS